MKLILLALLCILFSCNLNTQKNKNAAENEVEFTPPPFINKNDSIRIVLQSNEAFYQYGDSIKYKIEVLGANLDSGQLTVNGFRLSPDSNGLFHWKRESRKMAGDLINIISWKNNDGKVLSSMASMVHILPPQGSIYSEYGEILYRGIENEVTGFCVKYNHAGLVARAIGGKIKRSGGDQYLVTPDDTSKTVSISMRCKSPVKINKVFDVRDLPKPTLALAELRDTFFLGAVIYLPNQQQIICEKKKAKGIEVINGQINEVEFEGPSIRIAKSREVYFREIECKCPGDDSFQTIKMGIK